MLERARGNPPPDKCLISQRQTKLRHAARVGSFPSSVSVLYEVGLKQIFINLENVGGAMDGLHPMINCRAALWKVGRLPRAVWENRLTVTELLGGVCDNAGK